jgi:hypothetical protein
MIHWLLLCRFIHLKHTVVDSQLSHPVLNALSFCHHRVKNANEPSNPSLAKNVAWTISNLCRGNPVPEMDIVKDFIVPLLALLDFANEDPSACDTIDIRINAVWTLSYLLAARIEVRR